MQLAGIETLNGSAKLHALAHSAYSEFGDIADYVWKSPRLIEAETKLEIEKLKAYFPLSGSRDKDAQAIKFRKTRWFF
jgi:hypothetical protein